MLGAKLPWAKCEGRIVEGETSANPEKDVKKDAFYLVFN